MDAPSDLIVDVARAADPARAATVTNRLEALAASGGVENGDFASAVSAAGSAQASSRMNAGASSWARTTLPPPTTLPPVTSRADKARVQFEATILNSFVSEMMPKDASSVYGEGYAGDMWKSLLAEKISNEIAKSGSLGLTKTLFSGGGHATAIDKLESASHTNASQAEVTQTSANALSLPVGGEAADGAFLFSHSKTL